MIKYCTDKITVMSQEQIVHFVKIQKDVKRLVRFSSKNTEWHVLRLRMR